MAPHPADTETAGAPGELELVRRFVNTYDHETGAEDLASPAALSAWLAEHRLGRRGANLGDADLARAVELREALREALLANNDEPLPPTTVKRLNAALAGRVARRARQRRLHHRPRAGRRGPGRRPGSDRVDRPRGDAHRRVVAAQGLSRRRLPVGVLRPLAQPLADLVRMEDCGNRAKVTRLPRAPVALGDVSAAAGRRLAAERCQTRSQALDHSHLWHPFTQQQGWCDEEPLVIERAEGTDLIDADGRRYIDGVSSLWCNVHGHRHPGHRQGDPRPARPRRPLDDAGPHPRPRRRAGRAAGRDRAAGPQPRLLLGLRVDGDRDRAQDGVPVLAAAGRRGHEAHLVRLPARRLPRGHRRRRLGRRDRPLPLRLRAAALRRPPRRPRRRRRARVRARLPRRRDRRGDRRAARPGSGGDPGAAARLPAPRPRALRPPRRVPDLRRGRHRLRADRARCSPASRSGSRPTSSASPRA